MSRYVKRCQGEWCGQRVQGLTSFRLVTAGQRADLCRFCEKQEKANCLTARALTIREQRLRSLKATERSLVHQLARVRLQIRRVTCGKGGMMQESRSRRGAPTGAQAA